MATMTLPKDASSPPEDGNRPARRRMTLEEFNALPDDPTVDRMLIRGELWEKPMTKRNRWHAKAEASIGYFLRQWCETLPAPRPEVYSGEVGCDLPELGTGVGIDVALFPAELIATQAQASKFIVGAPLLAVEILSLTDDVEEIVAKVRDYLESGTKVVWIVNPYFKTVEVHRPDSPPQAYSGDNELCGDPELLGLRVRVSSFFD